MLHWIVQLLGDKQSIETEKQSSKIYKWNMDQVENCVLPIKQCKRTEKWKLTKPTAVLDWQVPWNILEFEILNNFLLNAHDSRTEFRIYLINGLKNKCILQKYMILTYCVVFDILKELKQLTPIFICKCNNGRTDCNVDNAKLYLGWGCVKSMVRFEMIVWKYECFPFFGRTVFLHSNTIQICPIPSVKSIKK